MVLQVPDLSRLLAEQWSQFAAEAQVLAVAALFVWPVHIGAATVGTLTGYRHTAGPLTPQQSAEGWLVADVLAEHVLARWPVDRSNGPGHAGAVDLHRAEVHQATGVLSHRLSVSLPEALDRLRARAYAYASGLSLTDAARTVIRQELPHDVP